MRSLIALSLIAVLSIVIIAPLVAQALVDVNTANSIELQKLYRIGPKRAATIIAEREANGPFSSLTDLAARVKGIGPKTIEKWQGIAVCGRPGQE